MENERDFKGIWIPKEIYLSKLPWMAKILYCEIDSFTKNGKECFISNKYFADFLGISETLVSKYISLLKEYNLIEETGFDGRKRYLASIVGGRLEENFKADLKKTSRQDTKKLQGRLEENFKDTNTCNNSITNSNYFIDKSSKIKENKDIFEEARKIYKGTKRGCNTEFEVFIKHKDWQEVLPTLKAAIQREIEYIEGLKKEGKFAPEYKHFKTWLNQRCWENEFLSTDNKIINETELKRKKAMIKQFYGEIE